MTSARSRARLDRMRHREGPAQATMPHDEQSDSTFNFVAAAAVAALGLMAVTGLVYRQVKAKDRNAFPEKDIEKPPIVAPSPV